MKLIILALMIAVGLIAGVVWYTGAGSTQGVEEAQADNVRIVDGMQIVDIAARGGYSPQRSVATAGVPTVLRFETQGTFDCSSAVRIPSMDLTFLLPATGEKDVSLGTPPVGALQGTCSMGMYSFEVAFEP